jgi:hypothetical protein
MKYYNYRIVFYSDPQKRDAVRIFDLSYGSPDLQYAYVDENPAVQLWTRQGLMIDDGEEHLVQLYPDVSTPEITCGIPYYTRLLKQVDGGPLEEVDSSSWARNVIDGSKLEISGISAEYAGDQLAVAYTAGNAVKIAVNNSSTQTWSITDFSALFSMFTDTPKSNPSLGFYAGELQLGYCDQVSDSSTVLRLISEVGGGWDDQPIAYAATVGDISIVTQSGQLYIYFRSQENAVSSVSSAHIVGNAWQIDSLLSGGENDCRNRAFGVGTQIHLAYILNNNLLLKTYSSGWGTPTLLDSGEFIGRPDIGESSSGIAVVYAVNAGGIQSVKCSRNIGNAFSTSTVYVASNGESLSNLISVTAVRDILTVLFLTSNGLKIATLESSGWLVSSVNTATVYDGVIDSYNGHPALITVEDSTPYGASPSVRTTAVVANFYNGAEIRFPGLQNEFKCDCASSIFDDPATHVDLVPRWETDIRITDNLRDCLRPQIDARKSSDAVVVSYQAKTESDTRILGGSYRKANQNRLYATGSRSWFDYDFAVSGTKFGFANDLYDSVVLARMIARPTGMPGLHNNVVAGVYRFPTSEDPADYPPAFDVGTADTPSTYRLFVDADNESLILEDPYISKHLVKKIRVTNVDRLTFNSRGSVVPVVSIRDVTLQMYGTPEVYAFRIRNENGAYTSWSPWSPEPGRYYTESKWQLSSGPGLKQICVQLMSYAGKTSEFCLQIVADYDVPVIDIKLYYEVDGQKVALPQLDLLPVASINDKSVAIANLTNNIVTLQQTRTVHIEVAVANKLTDGSLYFDVVQQGYADLLRQKTQPGYVQLTDGRMGYKGSFPIHVEDNRLYKDGLARVVVDLSEFA